nr:hypothetical protein [Tanacetum cinerariifolium]
MLKKGNYIPWESRFRRSLDNKLKDGERMWNSIQNGPYQRPMIPNLDNTQLQILEPLSKMTKGNKKQYITDVKVMNYLLQAIPNDIYNSVDAYRNNVHPISVSINTKYLNCLQPEWSKYVTIARYNQNGDNVSYDVLYDSLVQFEPHVLASKGVTKGFSRGQAYNCYDVIITQKLSTPTNNRLHNSSNTRNQVVVQDGRVDIQTKNAGYGGNANKNAWRQNKNQVFNAGNKSRYAYECQKPKVCDAKYFREQMLVTMKDEPGSSLTNKENDFILDSSYGEDTLEKLTAAVIMVNASSKVHEQVSHVKRKTIIQTTDDDQIDSSIIFDDPFVEQNGGTSGPDSNAHDEYHDIKMLAYNNSKKLKIKNV